MKSDLYEKMIRSLVKEEDKKRYSHLIVLIDNNDREYIKLFVEREENIKDILFNVVSNPNYSIKEIYNYDMDLEVQIKEEKAYNIKAFRDLCEEAYNFAKEKHNGQFRLGGRPYIVHPCKVVEIVKKYFSDCFNLDLLIMSGYLHDTIEDSDTSEEEIKYIFGEEVLNLVLEVTNDDKMKSIMGKSDYLCYKLLNMSDYALDIKLCDRLANVLDLVNAPDDFVNKYEIETIVILSYLISNRRLNSVQLEIIKEINDNINKLRKPKILELVKRINN